MRVPSHGLCISGKNNARRLKPWISSDYRPLGENPALAHLASELLLLKDFGPTP